MEKLKTVTVCLSVKHTEILAKITKQLGFSDLREISASSEETYQMVYALAELRQALADEGITVR